MSRKRITTPERPEVHETNTEELAAQKRESVDALMNMQLGKNEKTLKDLNIREIMQNLTPMGSVTFIVAVRKQRNLNGKENLQEGDYWDLLRKGYAENGHEDTHAESLQAISAECDSIQREVRENNEITAEDQPPRETAETPTAQNLAQEFAQNQNSVQTGATDLNEGKDQKSRSPNPRPSSSSHTILSSSNKSTTRYQLTQAGAALTFLFATAAAVAGFAFPGAAPVVSLALYQLFIILAATSGIATLAVSGLFANMCKKEIHTIHQMEWHTYDSGKITTGEHTYTRKGP